MLDVANEREQPAPRRRLRLPGPYRVMQDNRSLALLFGGQAVSAIGDWLYITVLVVYAYTLTGSAAVAGLLTFTRLLPYALFLPLSGVLADRFDRKRLMIVADLGRAACMLGLLAVHSRETVWIAFPLVFVSTCLFSLFRPALSATLPAVAGGDERLVQANALMAQISGLSLLLGPGLGGLLLLAGLERGAFVINGATYLVSAATLLRLRIPAREAAERIPAARWAAETLTGFRVLWRDGGLEAVTLTTAAGSWFNGAVWTLMVVLAERSWGLGAHDAGFLSGAVGVGGLLSGFLVGGFVNRFRLGNGYVIAMAATSALIALVGLSPAGFVAAGILAAYGLCDVLNEVMGSTVVQRGTPDELLGRVFGALETVIICALMLGALTVGPLVAAIGPRATTVGFALVPAAMLVIHLPRLRRLDAAEDAAAAEARRDERAVAGAPAAVAN